MREKKFEEVKTWGPLVCGDQLYRIEVGKKKTNKILEDKSINELFITTRGLSHNKETRRVKCGKGFTSLNTSSRVYNGYTTIEDVDIEIGYREKVRILNMVWYTT